MSDFISVYTDGSCLKNPGGSGGYAFLLVDESRNFSTLAKSFFEPATTNNRMELKAIISAVKFLNSFTSLNKKFTIYSDSEYSVKGFNEWSKNWIKKNFKDVKNDDLWRELLSLNFDNIQLKWVKAHDINRYNNFVDKIAKQSATLEDNFNFYTENLREI